ncbi:uncharacterized protein LOC125213943 isoform X1 [Salvia hispanica]|uniref:uncharacterized protein LOC125213943 isoform X1 n=1 Tax=Salvia hispanica TaxID=49212 RepID=UPI002009DB65|nr:uncharacterized protein LOC125213943 isoform X1 [Salvia hispanica]
METLKNQNPLQFCSTEVGNQEHHSELQVSKVISSAHANASLNSAGNNFSEAKPVHNYSIQTGEEFSLEFMRDRVNPKKPVSDVAGNSSNASSHLELKGILGNNHTVSESGSAITMMSTAEKDLKEFERNNFSLHGDKFNNGSFQSMQSAPCSLSGQNSQCTLVYARSGTSYSSSTKLKVLCSFGGRILPRPIDGRLRYVGGETRIIRIHKGITWKELWQKAIAIYDETWAVKYQLPGEELDALVSVSSDEDVLNMMEECDVLEDGEGSKKLRMFLFSLGDLDDAHFSLINSECDSEMKFVVAINGMGIGSRKDSTLCGLANFSGNNLNNLDARNQDKVTSWNATQSVATVRNSTLPTFVGPSREIEPSNSNLRTSSTVCETDLLSDNGQTVNHNQERQQRSQFGYNVPTSYYNHSEISTQQSSNGIVSDQKGLEGKSLDSLGSQGTKPQETDTIQKVDGIIRQERDNKDMCANESFVPSQVHSDKPDPSFPVEESCMVPKLDRELSSKSSKGTGKPEEHVQVSKPLGASTPDLPTSSNNESFKSANGPAPDSIISESGSTNLSYFGSSNPPPRIFRSEWVPREQSESLGRISKSDDSRSSQFLVNQPEADISQRDLDKSSIENLDKGNANISTKKSTSTERPFPQEHETTDDGLANTQKLAHTDPLDAQGFIHENHFLKTETEQLSKLPTVCPEDSIEHSENSLLGLVDEIGSQEVANDVHEYSQPLALAGNVEEPSGAPETKQGDILIDISDRFPSDLLSDIFSKAFLSDNASDFGPLQKDGAGVSMNIENHDPKRWSFFQRLAGDEFTRTDVSLIDQDHIAFSSGLKKLEDETPLAYDFVPMMKDGVLPSHMEVQDNHDEDGQNGLPGENGVASTATSHYNASQLKDGFGIIGLPPLDHSLADFDITALQIIKNTDLEELRELGSGTFGTVYHGKWRGSDVAIKRIKKSCFTGRQSEQERLTFEFWREAEILSKLHHPNVVAFYGVVQDGPGGTLATVTEYMVDGSLRHVLLRKDRHLDRRKKLTIAMDAAFGMEYLHSKNIVHFDLKCDNLLVNLKDPSRPICKVGDFGLSKIKRNTLVSGGVRGTLPWMAPELLNGSSNKVSEKVDVFSFGIVLWEILTGEEPYANMHYGAIIGGIVNNTLRPTIPSYCDSEWRRLMEECWAPNPSLRPSFTEIASRLRVMSSSTQTTKKAGS